MRVIAGRYKGYKLLGPRGGATRPTGDRVKENLYNILSSRNADFFVGKSVLDLFAGTGALGIEALSRGAKNCVFVDNAKSAIDVINANIAKLQLERSVKIIKTDARNLGCLKPGGYKFDIIFADPPYEQALGDLVMQQLLCHDLLNANAFFILEESSRVIPLTASPHLCLLQRRNYGAASLFIYQLQLNGEGALDVNL